MLLKCPVLFCPVFVFDPILQQHSLTQLTSKGIQYLALCLETPAQFHYRCFFLYFACFNMFEIMHLGG